MKISKILTALSIVFAMTGCDSNSGGLAKAQESEGSNSNTIKVHPKVDYSKGRAMNKRLGKGINLGNSWDGASYYSCGTLGDGDEFVYTNLQGETKTITISSSQKVFHGNLPTERYNHGCRDGLDNSWSNAIKDEYFQKIKDAGFNSIRLPVRWQHNSDPVTHTVNPDRLKGVMEDVKLANDAGLAVVVSFHWYYEIMFAANNATKYPDLYEAEMFHFVSLWSQIASAFEAAGFSDDMLVWDILNEPITTTAERLNEVMNAGYQAIRSVAPGKTIMFESKQSAKFAEIENLNMPADGNIIFSGHYYEPYGFTHQGHSYECKGDAAYSMNAPTDFKNYTNLAKKLYPDVVAGLYIPMNMGEFGVSGGPSANKSSCKAGTTPPSEAAKARWAKAVITVAEQNDISWHYWGFVGVGGFEAYDKNADAWYEGFPAAFGL